MEALQLVKFSEDGSKVELNYKTLEKALHQVRDHRVVVVSVVGAYRRGKSFLLNFLLRYLKSQGSTTWLSDKESQVKGFSWRFDVNRVTTGIMLWPQAFVVNDVAVLLLDTQGTFDNVTTLQESTAIVAITALISSITIFNMSERIESKDLDNLRFFLEYGGLAYEQAGRTQYPFQETIFLVRDWKFTEQHEFGYEGGLAYLDSVLNSGLESEDLRNVKENLKKCFEKTSCFLMPFPGGKVARDRNFQGKLGDINENFLKELKELVESMISPGKLKPKHLGKHDVLARDLPELFHALTLAFNSETLPKPTTLLQMFSETVARRMVHQAHATYEKKMKEHMAGTKVVENLDVLHKTVSDEIVSQLTDSIKLGGDILMNISKEILLELIEKSYQEYVVRLNEERKRIAEAEKDIEAVSHQVKEKEAEKVQMEQKIKMVDTELNKKKDESLQLEHTLKIKEIEIKTKESEVKLQEENLNKKQEENKKISKENEMAAEELKRIENMKKATIMCFNDIIEICQNAISRNQSMTTFDLFSAILTKLTKKHHKTAKELIRGYEDLQAQMPESDPVHSIVSGFIVQLNEPGSTQVEVPKEHLEEFVNAIKSFVDTLA